MNDIARLEPSPRVAAVIMVGMTLLAGVLRFWRLGDWSFQATEIFTLRDSVTTQWGNPRPLGYMLNYYLVRPFLPLDEFGLRLLPATFGVLSILVLYLVTRRLVGTRAALFAALLLTLSPLLVMYSQLARYWSLVFFLSAIYPYALYLGVRDRSSRAIALGLVAAVLAALAHPVSILLFGGALLWFLGTYLRPGHVRELWRQQVTRWAALILVVLGVAIALRFVPLLQSWISQHDKNPGSGQFLLRAPPPPGLKQLFYVLGYVESLTPPLVIIAILGVYLLWRRRNGPLASFLTSVAAFPILFLALLSLRTPVSQYYLLATAPAFFIAGGVLLDHLCAIDWQLRPQWLLPATVTLFVIAAGMPTLISDYRDGRRYDFRWAAHWVQQRLSSRDMVYSDQHMVLRHYMGGTPVYKLRETGPLGESLRNLGQSGGGALWLVAPAPSHPFRTNLKRGGLIDWIHDHCQLRNTLGVGRVDLRQHYLQLYRCPPAPPGLATRAGTAPTAPAAELTRLAAACGLARGGSPMPADQPESVGARVRPFRANTSRYRASQLSATRFSP